jgi:hypothetical protein
MLPFSWFILSRMFAIMDMSAFAFIDTADASPVLPTVDVGAEPALEVEAADVAFDPLFDGEPPGAALAGAATATKPPPSAARPNANMAAAPAIRVLITGVPLFLSHLVRLAEKRVDRRPQRNLKASRPWVPAIRSRGVYGVYLADTAGRVAPGLETIAAGTGCAEGIRTPNLLIRSSGCNLRI